MNTTEEKRVELWINEDPKLRDFISSATAIYKGTPRFVRNGYKKYQAKLDVTKLIGVSNNVHEAFFELDLTKKKNSTYKDFFFLKIVDKNKDINTIKIF